MWQVFDRRMDASPWTEVLQCIHHLPRSSEADRRAVEKVGFEVQRLGEFRVEKGGENGCPAAYIQRAQRSTF